MNQRVLVDLPENPRFVPSRMGVHFSSATVEWPTPDYVFDALNGEFGFTVDVCASPDNAKCKRFFTSADAPLQIKWAGICWMNPPYGRDIWRWMRKAAEAAYQGATVVCLVPSRTDSRWWHEYAMRAAEIRFLRGRLKFGNAKNSAPFPSAVVIFRPALPAHGTARNAGMEE